MVLLGEAFYGRGERLNLSLEGGGTWFVSLIIIDGRHRVSKYYTPFCLGSNSMTLQVLSHR